MSREAEFNRMREACDNPKIADEAAAEILADELGIPRAEALEIVKNNSNTEKTQTSNVLNRLDIPKQKDPGSRRGWFDESEEKKERLGEFLREHSSDHFGEDKLRDKDKPKT